MIIILTAYLLVAKVNCQEVYEYTSDVDPSDLGENSTRTQLNQVANTTALPEPLDPSLPTERTQFKDVAGQNKYRDKWIQSVAIHRSNEKPILSKTRSKNDATSWKIDVAYSEPKTAASKEVDNNVTDSREIAVYDKSIDDNAKPFKPSPPLESYFDLNDFSIPPKKPDVTETVKDDFGNSLKFVENSFSKPHPGSKDHVDDGFVKFPYKFERQTPEGFHKWSSEGRESKPASIPAGGLYQVPFALHKERPRGFEREREFELFHGEFREHRPKKKNNPWKGLVHLVTALLPVGLIVSALSPNVITIETPQSRSRFKRSLEGVPRQRPSPPPSPLSPPAESCRRRILCELYASPRGRTLKAQLELEDCSEFTCAEPRVAAELMAWVRRRLRGGGGGGGGNKLRRYQSDASGTVK